MKAEDLLSQLDWLRALALQIARDPELAEDVAQDACVIALQRRPDDSGSLRSWLARIVRNLVSQRVRGEGRRRDREVFHQLATSCEEPELLVERLALQRELASWVLELEEPHRSTLLLRFYGGLTLREIARQQDVSAAVVHERLRRTLSELRRRLDRSAGGTAMWSAVLIGSSARIETLLPTSIGALLVNVKIAVGAVLVVAGLFAVVLVQRLSSSEAAGEPRALAASPASSPSADESVEQIAADSASESSRSAVSAPGPEKTQDSAVESRPASILQDRERLQRAVEASLRGDLDAGTMLDLGLALVALDADPRAIPELSPGDKLQYRIAGTPAGMAATLEVDRTIRGERTLNLRVVLDQPSEIRMIEGAPRLAADIQIYARGDGEGQLSSFSCLTQQQISGSAKRAMGLSLNEGKFPTGLLYYVTPGDPLHPAVTLSGIENGHLFDEPLTSWRTIGGPWPRWDEMERLHQGLQAMYAKLAQ